MRAGMPNLLRALLKRDVVPDSQEAARAQRLQTARDTYATGSGAEAVSGPTTTRRQLYVKVANPSETVMSMLECGMSFQQMERLWTNIGCDIGTFRDECEEIICSENAVTPRHKASLGLELLRRATSDVSLAAACVISSLWEELDDPPERFCDPVMIETGYVFDRTTVFDERGRVRFNVCPMTRQKIKSSAYYPVVFLKKELIEHKQQRFDAVIAAAREISNGPIR